MQKRLFKRALVLRRGRVLLPKEIKKLAREVAKEAATETPEPKQERTMQGLFVLVLLLFLLSSGCASFFPKSESSIKSRWSSYKEAQEAFDRIIPYQTKTNELEALGFNPFASPNVKVLTYLDVIQRFIPNQSITKEDLDAAVRNCIEAKDGCHACEIELKETNVKRFGNLCLDVFGFKQKTRETGWIFKAIILYKGDVVVYKLSSGQPEVDRLEKKVRPLGPFQELDAGAILRQVGSVR